ncbi:hypothetical protein AX14_004028 [Amanita brunnescens Koide BX004]|nr:hypothetical protein AX14_004028 [Amanita brunnescens Koide BX004]
MASTSSGPPGLIRPKSSPPPPPQPKIFSPTPSPAHKSWFSLLASPCPSPVTFAPPTSAFTMPATAVTAIPEPLVSLQAHSHGLVDNTTLINIAQVATPVVSCADPWTRAHVRACAHATDDCAACSIALICCSCRALRYTPGPPPSSPIALHTPPPVQRSRSASPALFRNIGNGPSPPGFDSCDSHLHYNDDAFSKALAECDTCDNSSCPRGYNAPATYTITVEQFDEGSEEFYDRTFRACSACNRSCKKSFLGHRIKSRTFDNSTRNNLDSPQIREEKVEPVLPASDPSRPPTPLEVFSVISYAHRVSCDHLFTTCPVCSLGIICCSCNKLHTAPARLKLRCAACSHFACTTCTTPYCCTCRKPWSPSDSPTVIVAARPRRGARSTKSSKKGSSSSSQSSGPGSLATAHSTRNSPDPFTDTIPPRITQSSTDEIDAFADNTVRLALPPQGEVAARAAAPSPSSNLPVISSGPAPVFSRPDAPAAIGGTEDIPTAVPSRAPSRAESVVSATSTGDAGIAELLQPGPFAQPTEPPRLTTWSAASIDDTP